MDDEVARFSYQHDVIKNAMGGLVEAPLDLHSKSLRILDSATHDGTWVRDLAISTACMHHELVGTDIDPSHFPDHPPAGMTFRVQDFTKPWPVEWRQSFDLVHQRLSLGNGGTILRQVVWNLCSLVKPGGWIQLIECSHKLPEENGPAMRGFVTVLEGVQASIGVDIEFDEKIAGWLKEAGFGDIEERLVEVKLGASNPNPQLAELGILSTISAARALANYGQTLPVGAIPLSMEKIASLPTDIHAELTEIGGVHSIRVLWGRKPPA
ncbi:hypothetical protein BCR34DRAFT_498959 [Clohesyomyces aquaticus]|uniref:S-adenosyl-L-methionine-dependent methyltransferase n=1 Tax=Clohesyomyces aquaticus TaxID=1231657 RepID=A0A1Y1YAN6_9PLEO|nr:hypothetical protein BCR34DRAFT_498959 [Clohesyomyces aquaticus]